MPFPPKKGGSKKPNPFAKKDDIAQDVNATMSEQMAAYGFTLVSTLITRIALPAACRPDARPVASVRLYDVLPQSAPVAHTPLPRSGGVHSHSDVAPSAHKSERDERLRGSRHVGSACGIRCRPYEPQPPIAAPHGIRHVCGSGNRHRRSPLV